MTGWKRLARAGARSCEVRVVWCSSAMRMQRRVEVFSAAELAMDFAPSSG